MKHTYVTFSRELGDRVVVIPIDMVAFAVGSRPVLVRFSRYLGLYYRIYVTTDAGRAHHHLFLFPSPSSPAHLLSVWSPTSHVQSRHLISLDSISARSSRLQQKLGLFQAALCYTNFFYFTTATKAAKDASCQYSVLCSCKACSFNFAFRLLSTRL